MKLPLIVCAAALSISMGYSAATAQTQNCAPRDGVIEHLAEKYGETRQSIGLGNNNMMVEVFASEETGTWTITVTSPEGIACLVASGQAFERVADALPPQGDPT